MQSAETLRPSVHFVARILALSWELRNSIQTTLGLCGRFHNLWTCPGSLLDVSVAGLPGRLLVATLDRVGSVLQLLAARRDRSIDNRCCTRHIRWMDEPFLCCIAHSPVEPWQTQLVSPDIDRGQDSTCVILAEHAWSFPSSAYRALASCAGSDPWSSVTSYRAVGLGDDSRAQTGIDSHPRTAYEGIGG